MTTEFAYFSETQAGAGVTVATISSILPWGLFRYIFRIILHAWALLYAITAVPHFFKPRIPVSQYPSARPLTFTLLRNKTLWILEAGNFLQGHVLPMPLVYLQRHILTATRLWCSSDIG